MRTRAGTWRAWYAVHHRVTLYANGENIFDTHYQDVLGYKGQLATIREV